MQYKKQKTENDPPFLFCRSFADFKLCKLCFKLIQIYFALSYCHIVSVYMGRKTYFRLSVAFEKVARRNSNYTESTYAAKNSYHDPQ